MLLISDWNVGNLGLCSSALGLFTEAGKLNETFSISLSLTPRWKNQAYVSYLCQIYRRCAFLLLVSSMRSLVGITALRATVRWHLQHIELAKCIGDTLQVTLLACVLLNRKDE